MNIFKAPTYECWDPEIASHLDCDMDPVYLSLGRSQLLQIFRTNYVFTKQPSRHQERDITVEALSTHFSNIERCLQLGRRRYHNLHSTLPAGTVGEGSDESGWSAFPPFRTTAGFEEFKQINAYLTDNVQPGVLYLKGRLLRRMPVCAVTRYPEDGEPFEEWQGSIISEVGLGFVCHDRGRWCKHITLQLAKEFLLEDMRE